VSSAPTSYEWTVPVNDSFLLTELRVTDIAALVLHLTEYEIYERTLRIPFPYSAEDARNWVDKTQQAADHFGHPIHFAIRTHRGELVGGCGLDDLQVGHRAELGYWLARPLWNRGVATAVVRRFGDFALQKWQLARLYAHVFEFNRASARVLEKSGFQLEGVLRRHFRKDDRLIDSYLYARLS
jgi:[ribosomal protein S5]-alanine N-acetyltransferase